MFRIIAATLLFVSFLSVPVYSQQTDSTVISDATASMQSLNVAGRYSGSYTTTEGRGIRPIGFVMSLSAPNEKGEVTGTAISYAGSCKGIERQLTGTLEGNRLRAKLKHADCPTVSLELHQSGNGMEGTYARRYAITVSKQ